ncbi:MAG: hypothetical protein LBP59_20430 [Planctomycetaceae bacterium]|jgi:hypothetical protein|nr:hypothetical protein [Planctomycetaceae bacterium]
MNNIKNIQELRQRNTQTFCFYGNHFTKEKIEIFLTKSNSIASLYGLEFDRLLFTDKNTCQSQHSKYSIKKLQKKFDNLELFSIISAFRFWNGGWVDDFTTNCNIDRNYALLTFADVNGNLSINECRYLLLELAILLNSFYCIYFEIPYNVIPSCFSCGIISGEFYKYFLQNSYENTIEKYHRFCMWSTGLKEKVYLRGVIRDVYQLNILCRPQAYFLFDGAPFIDCVRHGKIEGNIEEIAPERFLWTVPKSEIPNVTEKCDKAGFIFTGDMKDVPGDILWEDPDVAEYHKKDAKRETNGKIIKKFVEATNNGESPDPYDFLKIFE